MPEPKKTKHPETAAALGVLRTRPNTAEAEFKVAYRDFRRALNTLLREAHDIEQAALDADEVEDDPALQNRLATAANTAGAFRHLTEHVQKDAAELLRHFRQLRVDIESIEQNAKHYAG